MITEVLNLCRENRDLDLWRAGIRWVCLVLIDDFLFCRGQHVFGRCFVSWVDPERINMLAQRSDTRVSEKGPPSVDE